MDVQNVSEMAPSLPDIRWRSNIHSLIFSLTNSGLPSLTSWWKSWRLWHLRRTISMTPKLCPKPPWLMNTSDLSLWIPLQCCIAIKSRCQVWPPKHLGVSFFKQNLSILIYQITRDYPGLLCQSLKFRETVSLTLKNAVFKPIISFYVGVHISEGKTCIKNPKTCGPSKWPPLTNGMSYSCGQSVSIEKPRFKRRLSLSPSCFI